MKKGPDQGYFPEPAKSIFISDTPGQEEAAKREFAIEGLTLNFVSGSRYLGAYLGPKKALAASSCPGVSEMKMYLAGSGKYPWSGPFFINSFRSCALHRAEPSKSASSA